MDAITQVPTRSEIEQAVAFGVRAPSVHNTQPWRWVFRGGVLELHADRSRQLPALDPDGRSMLLSCGAALELARLGFAAAGWESEVDRPASGDLVGRIRPTRRVPVPAETVERARAAERRQTTGARSGRSRSRSSRSTPCWAAATGPGVYAYAVQRAEERLDLAVVTSWADRVETADPEYRAELPGGRGRPTRWRRTGCRPRPCRTRRPRGPAHRGAGAGLRGRDHRRQPLVELVDEQPLSWSC
jgi:nitroreductase